MQRWMGSLLLAMAMSCGGAQKTGETRPRVVVVDNAILIVNDESVHVPIEIPFALDSDTLDPRSHTPLDVLAGFLRDHTDLGVVEVQGHSDEQGSDDYNLKLSRRRAEAVVAYLVEQGVNPGLLHPEGYGATRPVVAESEESAYMKNRRVEFVILGTPPTP